MDPVELLENVHEAAEALRARWHDHRPRVGLILGSGLATADLPLTEEQEVSVEEIPGLPRPTVVGHRASWSAARLADCPVVILGGRSHAYEGVPLARATLGVRVLHRLGCSALIVTNAAGGIRADLEAGTLMRIVDHINLLGDSPLVGPHHPHLGERFVDLSAAYSSRWGSSLDESARTAGLTLATGVYAACLGPQYETPAEVRWLARLGADAVGMSTVPEVIVARQEGLEVLGLSLISNAAAGISPHPLSHAEVLAAGKQAGPTLARLLELAVRAL